jgi:hypothetical protein
MDTKASIQQEKSNKQTVYGQSKTMTGQDAIEMSTHLMWHINKGIKLNEM